MGVGVDRRGVDRSPLGSPISTDCASLLEWRWDGAQLLVPAVTSLVGADWVPPILSEPTFR